MGELIYDNECIYEVEFEQSEENNRHPERSSRVLGEGWLCYAHAREL